MNTHSALGLLRFPAFLTIWSAGIVFAMGFFFPADASLVQRQVVIYPELPALPSAAEVATLKQELHTLLARGDLASGTWQPAWQPEQPAPAAVVSSREAEVHASIDTRETAEVDPADTAGEALSKRPPGNVRVSVAATHAAEIRVPAPVVEARLNVPVPAMVSTMVEMAQPLRVPRPVSIAVAKTPVTSDQVRFDPLAAVKQTAREALSSGQRRAAYRLLRGNVTDGAADAEYLGLLAAAALAAGHHREAYVVYERLIELQPDNERWLAGLALCQDRLGLDPTATYQALAAQTVDGSALNLLALQKLGAIG